MKTFKDLEFSTHSVDSNGIQAVIVIDGCRVSVIQGKYFYSGTGTYEMMSDRIKVNGGIRGWVTPKQITAHLVHIQKNPLK